MSLLRLKRPTLPALHPLTPAEAEAAASISPHFGRKYGVWIDTKWSHADIVDWWPVVHTASPLPDWCEQLRMDGWTPELVRSVLDGFVLVPPPADYVPLPFDDDTLTPLDRQRSLPSIAFLLFYLGEYYSDEPKKEFARRRNVTLSSYTAEFPHSRIALLGFENRDSLRDSVGGLSPRQVDELMAAAARSTYGNCLQEPPNYLSFKEALERDKAWRARKKAGLTTSDR